MSDFRRSDARPPSISPIEGGGERQAASPPPTAAGLYASGAQTRRAVLGDAHVDRAEAAATSFDRPFQDYITHSAWGAVWSRPGLTRRERSLVTIALLAALGHDEELAMHARASRNTGASADDIKEALLHVAVYAGAPAANNAMKIAKAALAETENREEDHEGAEGDRGGGR